MEPFVLAIVMICEFTEGGEPQRGIAEDICVAVASSHTATSLRYVRAREDLQGLTSAAPLFLSAAVEFM